MQFRDLIELFTLPRAQVNLMSEKTDENDPFFRMAVQRFYKDAHAPHPKLLYAAGKYQCGYALCEIPKRFDDYFMKIEASARRNYKKAQRLGYVFKRFDYNAHLDDIRAIWMSTPVRQGVLPKSMREGQVKPISDPPSRSSYQDYPCLGIFKDGRLVAYAACLITGELCSLNDLYGHADYLEDGVVAMLVIEIVRYTLAAHPMVKFYGYGTYFGASESMRRFKRKFLFYPHRVTWKLESAPVLTLQESLSHA